MTRGRRRRSALLFVLALVVAAATGAFAEAPGDETSVATREGFVVAEQPESIGHSQPPSAETSRPPGGIRLQPGYQHRRIPTIDIDTRKGVIWKNGGPRIDYEIDFNGVSWRGFIAARGAGKIWTTSITLADGAPREIVVDDDGDSVVMSIGNVVHLTATDVKSQRDLAEVLLMLMTYRL